MLASIVAHGHFFYCEDHVVREHHVTDRFEAAGSNSIVRFCVHFRMWLSYESHRRGKHGTRTNVGTVGDIDIQMEREIEKERAGSLKPFTGEYTEP